MKRVNARSTSSTEWRTLLDPYSGEEHAQATYGVSAQGLARIAQLSVTASELHYLERRDGSPMDWLVTPSQLFGDVPPIVGCIDRCTFLEAMFFKLAAAGSTTPLPAPLFSPNKQAAVWRPHPR